MGIQWEKYTECLKTKHSRSRLRIGDSAGVDWIGQLEAKMNEAAKILVLEGAATLRDRVKQLRHKMAETT